MEFIKKSLLKFRRAASGVAIFSVTFAPPHAALVATVWGEELTGIARDVISNVYEGWVGDGSSNTNGQVNAASLPTTGYVSVTQPAAAYTVPKSNTDNFGGGSNNIAFMGEHGGANASNASGAFINAALSALGSMTTPNPNNGFGGGSVPSIGGGGGQPLTFAPPTTGEPTQPTKGDTTTPTNGGSTPSAIADPKEPTNGDPTPPTIAGPTEPTYSGPTGPANNSPTEPTNGGSTPPTVTGPTPFVPEIVLPITNQPVDNPPNPTDDGPQGATLPVTDPQACDVPGVTVCNITTAAVPEPMSLALLAIGLAGLRVIRRKQTA